MVDNIKLLKEKIEDEINKINDLYEKTISDLNKAFKEKHEKLIKQENDIKEKLQNEVTKTKENLENFLTQSNNEIKLNERINTGLKKLDKEEKNMLKILSYISKMNKNSQNMTKLSQELMKSIKFYYNEEESNIKYEEITFSGIPIPIKIEFKDVSIDSVNICWNIDKKINNKIEFRVEIKQENKNEEFKEIYKGSNTNYIITNLLKNICYEFRICSIINGENGPWTQIKKIKTKNFFYDSHIVKNTEESDQIIEWISSKGNIKNIKLIYRATEDGDSCESFFEKCKNKGPIISLVETKKKKRFGGFTKEDWIKSDYSNIKDPNAFLFSLDNKKIYKILKSQCAFSCYSDSDTLVYGNQSDGKGIYLTDNFLSNSNREDQSTRVYEVPSDFCLTGEKDFKVDEVEVYQIIFE